ncbi:MAG: hypothetical protein M3440_11990 [Chloroflexota bacterium]|nr:hypothetical protein [Chloroflexota bacterium]
MAQEIGLDTFTGTNWSDLRLRNADKGGQWARNTATPNARFYLFDGKVHCGQVDAGAGAAFYLPAVPASADYSVFCDYTIKTTIGHVGLAGRMVTSANTHYFVYADSANVWVLAKRVDGLITVLNNSINSPSSGTVALELRMTGTTIAFYVGGVLQASAVDSAITAAGRGGVRSASVNDANTGKHIDNLRIVDTSVAPVGRSYAVGFVG